MQGSRDRQVLSPTQAVAQAAQHHAQGLDASALPCWPPVLTPGAGSSVMNPLRAHPRQQHPVLVQHLLSCAQRMHDSRRRRSACKNEDVFSNDSSLSSRARDSASVLANTGMQGTISGPILHCDATTATRLADCDAQDGMRAEALVHTTGAGSPPFLPTRSYVSSTVEHDTAHNSIEPSRPHLSAADIMKEERSTEESRVDDVHDDSDVFVSLSETTPTTFQLTSARSAHNFATDSNSASTTCAFPNQAMTLAEAFGLVKDTRATQPGGRTVYASCPVQTSLSTVRSVADDCLQMWRSASWPCSDVVAAALGSVVCVAVPYTNALSAEALNQHRTDMGKEAHAVPTKAVDEHEDKRPLPPHDSPTTAVQETPAAVAKAPHETDEPDVAASVAPGVATLCVQQPTILDTPEHESDVLSACPGARKAPQTPTASLPPASGRPTSLVRRSLRVSSSDLQQTVKACFFTKPGTVSQSYSLRATAPPPELDMELRTLNIAALSKELLGLVLIGKGGGGLVFRAVWQGAQVAVKFMIGKSSTSVSMSALEAVLAASVNHPNVVQTYGFDVTRVRQTSFPAATSTAAHCNTAQNVEDILSTAAAKIMQDLERETQRLQIRLSAKRSRPSSQTTGSEVVQNNTALDRTSGVQSAVDSPCVASTLWESFTSDDGFGDPAELPLSDVWSFSQVIKELDLQPGMYLTHIVMEFCDRGTLLSALQRGVFRVGGTSGDAARFHMRVVLRAALRTARDIARGMQHLHASGIIHGDLKPGNVLLKGSRSDRRGFVAKIGDFGLSKVVQDERALEMPHWSTVTHMAPEVIRGTWCKASDVYSFGILLWQLVCGEPLPFRDMTVEQLVSGVSEGRLQLKWTPHCHPALVQLGQACVAFDPAKRPLFQEIGDVLVGIEQNVRHELRLSHLPP